MWKEAVLAYLKILCWYLHEGTEEIYEKHQEG
jgi:hypothetical protein